MPEEYAFPLMLGLAVIVMGAFGIGTLVNIRKGDQMLKWMRGGMPLIGERATMRWLGSSVVEVKLTKSHAPFRTAETLVVLEPRDVLILWGWTRWQGRRDLLIFRSQLSSAPKFELEILDPHSWTTHRTERDVKKKNWQSLTLPTTPLRIYQSGNERVDVQRLIDLASQVGGKLVRLSVHRSVPNLEVHWLMPNVNQDNAHEWFSHLKELARYLTA